MHVLYPDSATIMRPCELPSAAQGGTVLTLPLQRWPYNVKAMAMQMADNGRYKLMDGYVSYGSDTVWSQFQRFPILRSLIALQNTAMDISDAFAGPRGALTTQQGNALPDILPRRSCYRPANGCGDGSRLASQCRRRVRHFASPGDCELHRASFRAAAGHRRNLFCIRCATGSACLRRAGRGRDKVISNHLPDCLYRVR